MAVRYDLQDSLHGNTVPVDSTDRAVPPMSCLSIVIPAMALLAMYLMLSMVSGHREALAGQGAAPPVVLPRPASLEKRA
jgi:hypothetical protein